MAKSSAISIPCSLAAADEPLEVGDGAEVGVHRLVPAFGGADRPGAARIVRPGRERVVAALAVRPADRMDGRQVDDVEAQLRESRKLCAHAVEAAPGAREELVPGAEAGQLAVGVDLERRRPRLAEAIARRGGEGLVHGQRGAPEQDRALGQLPAQVVLAALQPAAQLALVGRDPVDPGLDAEAPPSRPVDLEGAGPLVVAERRERRLQPAGGARRLVAHGGAEDVVAVPEDPRRHVDAFADRPFHRVAAAVDLRPHLLDLDARRWVGGLRQRHVAAKSYDSRPAPRL